MLKKLASIKTLFLLAACLAAAGTSAEVFEFCNEGIGVYITDCQYFCQGDDATCRYYTGPIFWCETGWGICEESEPIWAEWDYKEYFCQPRMLGCRCIAGTVIDEGKEWMLVSHC